MNYRQLAAHNHLDNMLNVLEVADNPPSDFDSERKVQAYDGGMPPRPWHVSFGLAQKLLQRL